MIYATYKATKGRLRIINTSAQESAFNVLVEWDSQPVPIVAGRTGIVLRGSHDGYPHLLDIRVLSHEPTQPNMFWVTVRPSSQCSYIEIGASYPIARLIGTT